MQKCGRFPENPGGLVTLKRHASHEEIVVSCSNVCKLRIKLVVFLVEICSKSLQKFFEMSLRTNTSLTKRRLFGESPVQDLTDTQSAHPKALGVEWDSIHDTIRMTDLRCEERRHVSCSLLLFFLLINNFSLI